MPQTRICVCCACSTSSHDYTRDDIRFASVAAVDEAYAPAGPLAGWQGIKVFYVTRVDAPQAEVGLRLADQTPLLLEKTLGKGRVVLLSTGLDRLTTDLPLHPQFVAFVDRLASYLSGRGRNGYAYIRRAVNRHGNSGMHCAAGVYHGIQDTVGSCCYAGYQARCIYGCNAGVRAGPCTTGASAPSR